MSTTYSVTDAVQGSGQREVATLNSLQTLTDAGVLEDGISMIIKDRHSLQDEPSILSVYVNSLDISHADLKAALVEFRACPETRQRFDAERDAVSRDIQLTKHSQATEMAKASGDSIMEDALRRISGRLVRRSAASWAALIRTTLEDCEEWENQLEELEEMPSGSDSEDSNG